MGWGISYFRFIGKKLPRRVSKLPPLSSLGNRLFYLWVLSVPHYFIVCFAPFVTLLSRFYHMITTSTLWCYLRSWRILINDYPLSIGYKELVRSYVVANTAFIHEHAKLGPWIIPIYAVYKFGQKTGKIWLLAVYKFGQIGPAAGEGRMQVRTKISLRSSIRVCITNLEGFTVLPWTIRNSDLLEYRVTVSYQEPAKAVK